MGENNNLTQGNSYVNKPDNYLVWPILSTVLCCLPFGIAAIVYSTKVDPLWEKGDRAGAEDAAKKAKMWMLIAVGCGILASIVLGVLYFVGALAAFSAFDDLYY